MTRARSTLLDFLTAANAPGSPFGVGVITDVTPGASLDGVALVTVDWLGTESKATYGDHYTPVVGHTVLLARTQPLAILLHLIGTPPS